MLLIMHVLLIGNTRNNNSVKVSPPFKYGKLMTLCIIRSSVYKTLDMVYNVSVSFLRMKQLQYKKIGW